MDDFLGESARGCDCATECDEEKEPCGAFLVDFGVGVCNCVDFGELFAAAVEPVVGRSNRCHSVSEWNFSWTSLRWGSVTWV